MGGIKTLGKKIIHAHNPEKVRRRFVDTKTIYRNLNYNIKKTYNNL